MINVFVKYIVNTLAQKSVFSITQIKTTIPRNTSKRNSVFELNFTASLRVTTANELFCSQHMQSYKLLATPPAFKMKPLDCTHSYRQRALW